MVPRIFPPRGLGPVLDGGGGDEGPMVAQEVPTGGAVRQDIFGDQPGGALLDAAGVLAVGQSQVGKIDGEATATAQAAMAGESDEQIDGPFGAGIAEVMQDAAGHGVSPGAAATARAGAGGPVAVAPLDARFGQVFDAGDAFGDVRDV